MAKSREKTRAIELRKQGESVGSIARKLHVSKGSVSLWVAGVSLSNAQKLKLKNNTITSGAKGRALGAMMNKKKHLDIVNRYNNEAKEIVGFLSKRDLQILCAGLFWAEGSKTGSRFIFVNSDPAMIKIMFYLLTEVWQIEKERIGLTIQINISHKSRIKKVLSFWSDLLELPDLHFKKPYFIRTKSKKVYDNENSYFGTVRLHVARGSNVLYKMCGIINAVKLQYMSG